MSWCGKAVFIVVCEEYPADVCTPTRQDCLMNMGGVSRGKVGAGEKQNTDRSTIPLAKQTVTV